MANQPNLDPCIARLNGVTAMYPVLPPMEMKTRPGSDKARYSVELVFPEGSDAHKALVAAQNAAITAKWGNKPPANLKLAVKDPSAPSQTRSDGGPARKGEAYHPADGTKMLFTNAHSGFAITTWVGREKRAATEADWHSGMIVLAMVKAQAYSSSQTGSGVTCYLNLVWKIREGQHYAGNDDLETAADSGDVSFDDVGNGADDPLFA
jgi:hypothetical protein